MSLSRCNIKSSCTSSLVISWSSDATSPNYLHQKRSYANSLCCIKRRKMHVGDGCQVVDPFQHNQDTPRKLHQDRDEVIDTTTFFQPLFLVSLSLSQCVAKDGLDKERRSETEEIGHQKKGSRQKLYESKMKFSKSLEGD